MNDSGFDRIAPTPGIDEREEREFELAKLRLQERGRIIRWVVVAVLAASLSLAWLYRYELVASGGEASRGYILDRWTGKFYVLFPSGNLAPADLEQ